MTSDWNVLQQRIDELAGVRRMGSNTGRAAVRLDDLTEILRIPDEMSAVTATSSVSVANFNALLDDVRALHKALRTVKSIIRAKRGR